MIEIIHKYPVLIKTLLAFVTVTFILTGGWMLGREQKAEFAASVDGQRITMQEYQDAMIRTEEFYRRIYQGKLPDEVIKKMNLGKKTLDSLVDSRLIQIAAEKQGIGVTDEELAQAVRDNASFQDKDGRFSQARYTEVLKANGMNPAKYEKMMRESMVADKFRRLVKDSVFLSEEQVKENYMKQLKAQNKPYSEEEFKAKQKELTRSFTQAAQEEAMNSFMTGLRKDHKVDINSQLTQKES